MSRRVVTDDERRVFVLEHTRLLPVPLALEIHMYRADAVSQVWFETARWLDDDDAAVPFWSVPWAGGQALARYVLDHPEVVRGKRVLDFACGGGLVAIAAARAGAQSRSERGRPRDGDEGIGIRRGIGLSSRLGG